MNAELEEIERNQSITCRWNELTNEFKEALKLLEFRQKSALVRKLKHDVAEYHFLQETMRNHAGKMTVWQFDNLNLGFSNPRAGMCHLKGFSS